MSSDVNYQTTSTFFEDNELFKNPNEQFNDLHTYYMSQFNLELENGYKSKNVKVNEVDNTTFYESNNDQDTANKARYDFQIIDEVIHNNNVNEENFKDVLLDLDSIEYDSTQYSNSKETESSNNLDLDTTLFESKCDYIDDESLIDELCREDSEPYRLTPDIFNDSYLSSITNDKNLLPPMETAFSKHYCHYNNDLPQNCNEIQANHNSFNNNQVNMNSLDVYSYPNNVIYNINNDNSYILPDTPNSCKEFSYDRSERKVSESESIESDVNSSTYYDENSEGLDEDELFINLDEFDLPLDKDSGFQKFDDERNKHFINGDKKSEKDKNQGERACLWERCYERYPNQNSLVEHIERNHVNTYKGDEFSCLWRECARARRPFNARYKLLIHMRVHSGHKPNRCHHPGCGKAFSRLENLKIHVRSHTGERPYACPAPHCRKAFSNSSDRAKHQRTHFNARPYACGATGCGKRYTDPSSLRKHVKSHPHIDNVPRSCIPSARFFRKTQEFEQTVPSSPAKLATLRCIRNKLATVPRLKNL